MSRTALQKQLAAIGRKGGKARAEVLSKQRRKEIAAMGGKAPRKTKTAAIVLLLAVLVSPLHAQEPAKPSSAPLYWTYGALRIANESFTQAALANPNVIEANPLVPTSRVGNLAFATAETAGFLWLARWADTHQHHGKAILVAGIITESLMAGWNVRVLRQIHAEGF